MNNKIRIIIADDHPLFRMGVKSLLISNPNYYLLGEAENGENAINLINNNSCDIIILDIDMPNKNGIEVAEYIRSNSIDTRIVFLTSHSDLQLFNRAMDLNVKGFLFKESALEELNQCIQVVNNGEKYISPVCQSFLDENNEELIKLKNFQEMVKLLTPTELKILKYVANHFTTKSIAEALHNSYKTIENHRFNICQKLNIKGTNNLLSFAMDNKEYIETFDNSQN